MVSTASKPVQIVMKIRHHRTISETRWLNLFEVHYEDPGGTPRSWLLASRRAAPKCTAGGFERPDAVVIVAFHGPSQKVVVTREYRVPLADFEYGFPAGLVDPGESVAAAVARELREETGLELTRIVRSGPPVYSSAGLTDESVAMVYVDCQGTPSTAGNQGAELIEVLLVSPAEADRLCREPDLKFDAKAWLVLEQFARFGRL
jgi:ADP-ribose pyrophosphatase